MQTPITVAAVTVGADAVAQLRAEMYARKLVRLTINGPRGSSARVFIGNTAPSSRVDQTPRGDANTNDYSNPIPIPAGMDAFVVWPGKGALANQANATFATERL